MEFKTFNKIHQVLTESTKVENTLNEKLRPKLAEEVMKLLNSYSHSPLSRYIIQRIHNPDTTDTQKLEIGKVGNLDSYKKDKTLYDQLLQVKSGDIGPGEVLVSLTLGDWAGGTKGDYDVTIPKIGNVEVKFLTPFAKSTNVPMGSAAKKRLIHTDIPVIFNGIVDIIRKTPTILKRYLTQNEMEYFIDESIDQLEGNSDVSTNSLRLIGRILKSAKNQGDKTFEKHDLSFERLKSAMVNTLQLSMGDAEYVMFIGDKIESDGSGTGEEVGGKYYIMPREDIKYYMFYRIYDGDRIKIAPFTTEKDFFKSKIYNK